VARSDFIALLPGVSRAVRDRAFDALVDEAVRIQPDISDHMAAEEAVPMATEDQIKGDLASYLRFVDSQAGKISTDFNVLKWWRDVGSRHFPHLSDLAAAFLCIPASSAASERAFSSSGFLFSERRRSISPENLSDYCMIRANLTVKDLEGEIAAENK
jgi:hypothetical protein